MKLKTLLIAGLSMTLLIITGCAQKKEKKSGINEEISKVIKEARQAPPISIHEAALNGQLDVVEELISTGSNVNTLDKEERTALMYAAYNGHSGVIKKLIEKGSLINVIDLYGRTALMMASSGPYPDAVKLLLDNKADPNIADREEHFTAIMYAASEGQMEVVRLLLSAGADPSLKDVDGDDAAAFASNNGHKEVAALLQSLRK